MEYFSCHGNSTVSPVLISRCFTQNLFLFKQNPNTPGSWYSPFFYFISTSDLFLTVSAYKTRNSYCSSTPLVLHIYSNPSHIRTFQLSLYHLFNIYSRSCLISLHSPSLLFFQWSLKLIPHNCTHTLLNVIGFLFSHWPFLIPDTVMENSWVTSCGQVGIYLRRWCAASHQRLWMVTGPQAPCDTIRLLVIWKSDQLCPVVHKDSVQYLVELQDYIPDCLCSTSPVVMIGVLSNIKHSCCNILEHHRCRESGFTKSNLFGVTPCKKKLAS